MMRIAIGLACCLCSTGADLSQLHELDESKRIFELRRALESGGDEAATLFYRAMVAARFGQDAIAIEQLRRFLATGPNREMERKAHEELASALVRAARYGEAASEYAAALRMTPADDVGRADSEDGRVVCEALRNTPEQSVVFEKDVPVRARLRDSWIVPVNVNGKTAEWIFDTGANFSVVTESEAVRTSLSFRAGSTYANGSTGKRNLVRVAVAQDLRFGAARLHNVAFAVIADDALPRQAARGILGFPVMRALGRVGISAKGVVRIEPGSRIAPGDPNLFLDGLTPIVEVRHGGRALQMAVDTGAARSALYPSFRVALNPQERARLRKRKVGTTGVGQTIVRMLDTAPKLPLELPGKAVDLSNITLLSEQPTEFRYEDGVIGMDALASGFTLDFRAMQLRLD